MWTRLFVFIKKKNTSVLLCWGLKSTSEMAYFYCKVRKVTSETAGKGSCSIVWFYFSLN